MGNIVNASSNPIQINMTFENPIQINMTFENNQLSINLSLNAIVSSINRFSELFNLGVGLNVITHNLGVNPAFVSFYQQGQGALQLQWDYEGVNPLQQINVYCDEVFDNVLVNIL